MSEESEIYAMNADGSDLERVTCNQKSELDPSWSPDGTQIVFYADSNLLGFDIYVMNADGSNMRRLTYSVLRLNVDPGWCCWSSLPTEETSSSEKGNSSLLETRHLLLVAIIVISASLIVIFLNIYRRN